MEKWYTDTFHGRHKSVNSNTVSQFFANKQMFAVSYPLISKKYAGEVLHIFISKYGASEFFTVDEAAEQCEKGTLFMKQVSIHNIKHHIFECHHSNQN